MITFELSKEQDLIVKSSREFAKGEIKDIARDCDEEGKLPGKVLDKAWEIGLANAAVPEVYEGVGMERSAVTDVLIGEELGYGCATLASAILAPTAFIHPLIDFGTDAQKKKYLPPYAGEKFEAAGMAIHEPRHTFDPTDMTTTAVQKGFDWVINGKKRLVPFAATAKHLMVLAKTGNGKGLSTVDAFIVPKGAAGMTIDAEPERKVGLKALPCHSVTFKDCVVPGEDKLGGDQGIDGRRLINSVRVGNAALSVGICKAVLETCIPYVQERISFGTPIGKKQIIALYIAKIHKEIDAMRWMVWKAASQLDQGVDATKAATLARHWVNRCAVQIADDGVQIFGGHGYIRDFPLEMWLRNARTLTVLEGMVAA
jgi:alkylation response protein AidB-like acyl-CoA dehydrogenase